MSYITVGIVDYGMGNHASVIHSLRALEFRVSVSADVEALDVADVLLLPGVGAFPAAMNALYERGLVDYLRQQAQVHRPLVGICLGMQLLTSGSHEHFYTAGLNIIPGEVEPLPRLKGHIGWNTIECVQSCSLLTPSDGECFYFNHSFRYCGLDKYQVCVSRFPDSFASVIRKGSVMGIQFHPEKSQTTGRVLLKNVITGLCHA